MPKTRKDRSRIAKAGVETGAKMLGVCTRSAAAAMDVSKIENIA